MVFSKEEVVSVDYKTFTQGFLRECFEYNRLTGDIVWKVRPLSHFSSETIWKRFNTRCAGKIAGYLIKSGNVWYRRVTLCNLKISSHQIAWMLEHGEFLEMIDHISGDGLDNGLCNLRSATNSVNQKNRRIGTNNTTGCMGVVWIKRRGKYQAQIKNNQKNSYMGMHTEYWDAVCARKSAEYALGFCANHGRL